MSNSTAILLFSRTAWEEAQYKTFAPHKRNVAIAAKLIKHTQQTAISSGLDVLIPPFQKGITFGERLMNAIAYVFQQGYERVIVIGNDTPMLTKQHILTAHHQLQEQHMVIGPSTDGGLYLLGLHKACFHSNAFQQLDWQSAMLLASLERYQQRFAYEATLLETLGDLDQLQDFKLILPLLKTSVIHLYFVLINWLYPQNSPLSTLNIGCPTTLLPTSKSLRAPPIAA